MKRGFYSLDDEADNSQRDALEEVRQTAPVAAAAPERTVIIRDAAPPGETGGATKLDAGKAPVWQGFIDYFPNAMLAVAWTSDYGFRKYGEWGGWRKLPNAIRRYFDGNARHNLLNSVEVYDDGDSGLAHAAQDAWNAMAKLELLIAEGKVEIRRGNDIVNGKPVLGTARRAS